jgi:hypothetical protein
VQKHHQLVGGAPAPEWTAWKPGEWCGQQHGYERRQKVVAWHGSNLIGFLNVWPDFGSIHQPGKRVLYVEHLAAAPGNLPTQLWVRRFRRVGGALFTYAVLLSHQQGFEGRLGLHVADDAALGFYRWLNDDCCRGALLHAERTGVNGPTPEAPTKRARPTWKRRRPGPPVGWRSIAVPDPKIVDFKPRWWREPSGQDLSLEAGPLAGSIPEGPPRIYTRLVLRGGARGVSAKTLSEAVDLTQVVVQYAGCDVYHGVNPDFADLRSAGAEVFQLARLTVEPFEEGSFLIPPKLEAPEVKAPAGGQRRKVTTQDVVQRFDGILTAFQGEQPVTEVSIGAIQAVEALGRVIRREAESIEYCLFDTIGRPARPILVTPETITRVAQVRQARRPSQARLETLEGTVTALDLVEQRLQLSLDPSGVRVKGTFSMLFQPTLVERLGRRVRLHGAVERRGKRPVSIQVQSVEVPEEDG